MDQVILLLRKACGLGEGRIVGFHFEAGSVALVVFALIVLAVAAFLGVRRLYQDEEGELAPKQRNRMPVFKTVALLLALLVLFRPTLTTETPSTVRQRTAILIDGSHSMNIVGERTSAQEETTTTSRLDRVRPVIEELFQQITESNDLDCYRFDENADLLFSSTSADGGQGDFLDLAGDRLDELDPHGSVTALGDAVLQVLRGSSPPQVLLVVSDGASNWGSSVIEAARQARARGVHLIAAAVGGEGKKDLSIARFDVPDILPKGESANVRVYLQQNGYTDESVTVTLKVEDAELDRKTVRLSRHVMDVPLEFTPKIAGEFQYSVEVSPLAEEASTRNNSRIHKAEVLDHKADVLMVDRQARWEWRFALAALLRDERVGVGRVKAYLTGQDAAPSGNFFARTLPRDLKALSEYDVLILGDVPVSASGSRRSSETSLSTEQLSAIDKFVKEMGGGLIILAGPGHAPRDYWDTPIGKMMPVLAMAKGDRSQPFAVMRTATSLSRTLFSLPGDDAGREGRPLSPHPVLRRCFAGPAHPMAEPLAVHSKLEHDQAPLPVILLMRYGRGSVLHVGTDDLWRLRGPVSSDWHERFWVQAVMQTGRQKILGGNAHLELRPDKRVYLPGEPIDLQGDAFAEDFSASQAESVEVAIREATGQKIVGQAKLGVDKEKGGRFAGRIAAPEQEGSYVLSALDPASNEAVQVWLQVSAAGPEYENTRSDRQLLSQLAATAEGEFCELEELGECLRNLDSKQRKTAVISQVPMWDSPLLLLLFVAALAIEWMKRRKANLL